VCLFQISYSYSVRKQLAYFPAALRKKVAQC
jgi:hypothetical protein